ncbi:uncharacterized protein LOC142560551 [Dermacentor variabilis]|uniref:uncharacterized protein LOC142560551 n=1 Tax=Dermacentor variabilis TaxID=34621 RepID=UPI003F5C6EA7
MTCYARNCYYHSGRNQMKKQNCKCLYDIRLVHCRYGGTDTGHAVRTLLQGILTNEAALQFSSKGSQGRKHAFVKLPAPHHESHSSICEEHLPRRDHWLQWLESRNAG